MIILSEHVQELAKLPSVPFEQLKDGQYVVIAKTQSGAVYKVGDRFRNSWSIHYRSEFCILPDKYKAMVIANLLQGEEI